MFLVIDTVSGIILEESDTDPEFNYNWFFIKKDGQFTAYPPYAVIRVKQVTEEVFRQLEKQSGSRLAPQADAGYDEGVSAEDQEAFRQRYMNSVFPKQL